MYSYVAYGLGIHSALQLPELPAAEVPADVIVRLRDAPPGAPDQLGSERSYRCTPEGLELSWRGVATYLLRAGREVVVQPVAAVEERILRLFLLGPVFAALLHQRGCLVLHASAVSGTAGTVALLGESGWGKSTLAAALHACGFDLVADDVVPVCLVGKDPPCVLPSFPRLKLWPDAAAALGHDPSAMPRIRPEVEKREHRITSGFASTPRPLARIYVLGEGGSLALIPLAPPEAFVELVRHSYVTHLLGLTGTVAWHCRQCAGLAERVPVWRLVRQRSLAKLGAVTQALGEHLASAAA